MKNKITGNVIIGIGAFTGSVLAQYFLFTDTIDIKRAVYLGISFFTVMTISTLINLRRALE